MRSSDVAIYECGHFPFPHARTHTSTFFPKRCDNTASTSAAEYSTRWQCQHAAPRRQKNATIPPTALLISTTQVNRWRDGGAELQAFVNKKIKIKLRPPADKKSRGIRTPRRGFWLACTSPTNSYSESVRNGNPGSRDASIDSRSSLYSITAKSAAASKLFRLRAGGEEEKSNIAKSVNVFHSRCCERPKQIPCRYLVRVEKNSRNQKKVPFFFILYPVQSYEKRRAKRGLDPKHDISPRRAPDCLVCDPGYAACPACWNLMSR